MKYEALKQWLETLCEPQKWRNDNDLWTLLEEVKAKAVIVKNNKDNIGEYYIALPTEDRGVVLAVISVKFGVQNEQGLMKTSPSFVEDTKAYRCPQAVREVITDSQAADYLAQAEQQFPVAEEERIYNEFMSKRGA